METLVAHAIAVKQYEGQNPWRVDWDNLKGHQTKWFDTFAEASRFIESELL